MSQVLSSQQVSTSSTSPKYRRLTSATLWTVQALLAFLFLFAGGMKLIVPVSVISRQGHATPKEIIFPQADSEG